MKNLILKLKAWYEQLSLRERILFVLLVWAIIYAFFSLVFFRPVNNQRVVYLDKIRDIKSKVNSLELQIDAVNKIANSPLYQEWQKQHQNYEKMQEQYKSLISNFSASNTHEIIRTVVANHSNITLAHIENSPEVPFASTNATQANNTLFQQTLTLTIYGDYFNTIKYLQHLEKMLPNIHWDALKYEVVNYPTAKTTIGFSIFYGKNVQK